MKLTTGKVAFTALFCTAMALPAIVLGGLGVACSSSNGAQSSTTDGGQATDAPTDRSDGGLGDAAAGVNAYLLSLPAWPAPMPDSKKATGPGTPTDVTGSDNKSYSCTNTPYSLTSTPQQIVTFNPNVDVLWPGALLQGKPLQAGALAGLPITQRAPLQVTIPTLLSSSNTVTVTHPDLASVEQALGQMIGQAVQDNVQPSSSISYTETQSYSMTQASLDVGVSANYLGFSLDATFNYSTDASVNTIVGYFVQNMFTVAVPEPEQPGDLFSGLTQQILDQQIQAGNIGTDNLPVYVASVTYGRILMFSITSTASASDIEAALSAQYMAAGNGGMGSVDYTSLVQNSSTQIHVVALGGDATNAEAMIRTGDPTQFFTSNPALSTGVPISFTLRNLGNNSIAAVSETTSYSVQQCNESETGAGANFYVVDSAAGSVVTFDSKGRAAAISNPITGLNSPHGIAYDFADDLLFVTVSSGGGAAVNVYKSDGTAPSGTTTWSLNGAPSQVIYDPEYGRVYVVEPGNDVKAFTPQGQLQQTYPLLDATSATFDSNDSQLFVAFSTPPKLQRYALSGSLLPLASNGFAGLSAPALAYDPHHNLVLVGDSGKLRTFLPDGTPAASTTLQNPAAALVYDDADDMIVITDTTGLVFAFDHDLKAISLPNAAFSGVAQPTGIAYRP